MNNRIGILTFHNANNYGAALQAYALQQFIADLFPECTVEIMDYQTSAIRNQRSYKALKKSQGLVRSLIHYPFIRRRIRNIDRFSDKYMQLSPQIVSKKQLEGMVQEYRVFVSGSDQIWNRKLTGGEDTYLQDFHHGQTRKVSYAASMGLLEIPKEWKADYEKLLKDFDAISVREDTTRDILQNEFGIDSLVHIDPTLLLNENEWHKISNKKAFRYKFVLAYMVPFQNEVLDKAKTLADQNGLKLMVVCRSLKTDGGKYKGCSPVEEILSLFHKAEYVVTNSFHGTAFSVINHKRFVVFFKNPVGYNIRAKQLLTSCDILRESENKKPDIFECMQCNWETVEMKLEKKKEEARSYLRKEIVAAFDNREK